MPAAPAASGAALGVRQPEDLSPGRAIALAAPVHDTAAVRTLATKIGELANAVRVQKNWMSQILHIAGLRRPERFEMRLRCGYVLRAEDCDRSTCNEVWIEDMYALPVPMRGWKTIVEIGGHVGSTTLYFAHKAPDARIVVFEPSPRNFGFLRKNVEDNGLAGRVTPFQMAVSDEKGEKTFHLMGTTGGNSLFEYGDGGTSITVRTTTLGDVFAEQGIERCDLLKLDCEGAEYGILYGASDELLSRVSNIVLEYHRFSDDPRSNEASLRAFLEGKGYTVRDHAKHMLFAMRER